MQRRQRRSRPLARRIALRAAAKEWCGEEDRVVSSIGRPLAGRWPGVLPPRGGSAAGGSSTATLINDEWPRPDHSPAVAISATAYPAGSAGTLGGSAAATDRTSAATRTSGSGPRVRTTDSASAGRRAISSTTACVIGTATRATDSDASASRRAISIITARVIGTAARATATNGSTHVAPPPPTGTGSTGASHGATDPG